MEENRKPVESPDHNTTSTSAFYSPSFFPSLGHSNSLRRLPFPSPTVDSTPLDAQSFFVPFTSLLRLRLRAFVGIAMISAAAASASAILPLASPRNSTPPWSFWAIKQASGPASFTRRKAVCACVAPPINFRNDGFSSSGYDDQSKAAESLGVESVHEDESDVLIECRDVYKSFGEKYILRGVSFKIRHGEAVGIIGPSGTGKSTILKIIAGLLAPDKGDVYIRGKKRAGLVGDNKISGLRIGLVFQSAALFDSLTVRENVGFLLYENSNMPESKISKLVTETLSAVGLKGVEDHLPSELSGGMKKRVALARSIIFDNTKDSIEPEVLLYDEPTAGLDPIASTVVEDLIRSVHFKIDDAIGKPGKIASYVVVTHQHSTIRRAVDRLLFLYEGKVVWQGMTHEFVSSENPIVRQFASGSLDGPIRY